MVYPMSLVLRLFGGKIESTIGFCLVGISPNSVFGGGEEGKKDRLWHLLVDDFYLALLKYRIVVINKELSKL